MTVGLSNGQALSRSPETVNIFDLTAEHDEKTEDAVLNLSAKERVVQVVAYTLMTLVVLLAVTLLLGEAFGLQWRFCDRITNKTLLFKTYQWPWGSKCNSSMMVNNEWTKERWNSLSLQEKRNELFRASMGEVDLYDIYDIPKDIQTVDVN